MSNSSPGPDRVTYKDLKKADSGCHVLTAYFNKVMQLETVPSSWKTSNTVLLYKKGETQDLRNWRPIAIGDTTPKLYAAIMADRITTWAVTNMVG